MKTKIILLLMLFLSGCDNKVKEDIQNIKSQMATKTDINNLQQQIDAINQKIDNIHQNSKIIIKKEVNSSLVNEIKNMQKELKEINATLPIIPKNVFYCKGHFKPTTFITTKKTKIYNSKNKVVTIWPKCTSFTSYIEKNGRLRITGIFVHLKWQNALAKDWWIDLKDVAKKFKDKK